MYFTNLIGYFEAMTVEIEVIVDDTARTIFSIVLKDD